MTVLVAKIPRTQNERLQQLVAEIEVRIGPGRVIVYPTHSAGVLAWGVLAGLYPDQQQAQLAHAELLQSSKLRGTQVQTIGVLRGDMLLSRD